MGFGGRTTGSVDIQQGVIQCPNEQIAQENLDESPTPQNRQWVQTSKIFENDLYTLQSMRYNSQVEKTLPI